MDRMTLEKTSAELNSDLMEIRVLLGLYLKRKEQCIWLLDNFENKLVKVERKADDFKKGIEDFFAGEAEAQ